MRVDIVIADITTRHVDAVVNAANSSLLGGSGVDGAIHGAAGPELVEACRDIRRSAYPAGLPVGQAVATPGFELPARWVIHTVGPNLLAREDDPDLLRSCFAESLKLAAELGAGSVAFPAVGAGVYGWPVQIVAEQAKIAVEAFPAGSSVEFIEFVLVHEEMASVFREVFAL